MTSLKVIYFLLIKKIMIKRKEIFKKIKLYFLDYSKYRNYLKYYIDINIILNYLIKYKI